MGGMAGMLRMGTGLRMGLRDPEGGMGRMVSGVQKSCWDAMGHMGCWDP